MHCGGRRYILEQIYEVIFEVSPLYRLKEYLKQRKVGKIKILLKLKFGRFVNGVTLALPLNIFSLAFFLVTKLLILPRIVSKIRSVSVLTLCQSTDIS